jgi:hypothetical protein
MEVQWIDPDDGNVFAPRFAVGRRHAASTRATPGRARR